MRLVYGAGALAALSVMSVGLVRFASSSNTADATTTSVVEDPTTAPDVVVRHVIQYIHLQPGETAPPGAKVITPDAPAPQIVVTHAAAPAAAPRRVIVVTRPSGHP